MRTPSIVAVLVAACAPVDMTVGLGPHGVEVDGGSCVVGAGGPAAAGDAMSIDLWMRGVDAPQEPYGALVTIGNTSVWAGLEATGLSSSDAVPSDGWRTPVGLYDGLPHHIAVVWTLEDGAILFIDGVRSGRGEQISRFPPLAFDEILIGCSNGDLPGFEGEIDEVRVSNAARWQRNFQYPTEPWAADGWTVALYHFDLGYGEVVPDAAARFPAVLGGARWFDGGLLALDQSPAD